MQLSLAYAKETHHGIFDTNILCSDCDNKLGPYDDYILSVCRRFEKDHFQLGRSFILPDVDGDKFVKSVLAILWRSSISQRPEFKKISLGRYESAIRDVLFGAERLRDIPEVQAIVARYRKMASVDVTKMYSSPSRIENLGVDGWGITICGFRIFIKVDKRPWPAMPKGEEKIYLVNGSTVLSGMFLNFEGSDEHRAAHAFARAQLDRWFVRPAKHGGRLIV